MFPAAFWRAFALHGVLDGTAPFPSPQAEEAEEVEDDEYVVEAILAARGSGSERAYKLKWAGFGEDESSWEPAGICTEFTGCGPEVTSPPAAAANAAAAAAACCCGRFLLHPLCCS